MRRLLAKRLLQLIPVVLGVSILTFLLLNLLPGNAAVAALGDGATPEAIAALSKQLGLNDPLWLRYWHWLLGAVQGDLGKSLNSGQSVSSLIVQRVPVSIELMVIAQIIALAVALPVALLAARRRGTATDKALGLTAFAGIATPPFLSGMILILLIAIPFGLPATGGTTQPRCPTQLEVGDPAGA